MSNNKSILDEITLCLELSLVIMQTQMHEYGPYHRGLRERCNWRVRFRVFKTEIPDVLALVCYIIITSLNHESSTSHAEHAG